MARDIENNRALFAYDKVSEVSKKSYAKGYRTLIRSVPVMIQTNGLGATVSFLFSKKGDKAQHAAIYEDLSEWLYQQRMKKKEDDLVKAIMNQTRDEYKRMTRETMSLVVWMKRFAEGMIEIEIESGEK
ncbi:type III-B CRISPR module-associated protein Cmr5 [Paenibacillus faecalis]|uniref:type III-B CRISPR module-associated protein Cmr5 n=1 Tax=Paenibacillus faecalis TaxID=2079532 RepID=UPI00131A593F|nr:type III-B CRISPR module-associated protein Cmr5 [Paenibacillus faecalis]